MRTIANLRLLKFLAMVVGIIGVGFMGFAAIVGLSAAAHWVYIYPPVVGICVLVGLLWLLSWETDRRLKDSPGRDWIQ